MDSETLKVIWIGTGLAAGVGSVIALIAAPDNISKWSVCALVFFANGCFSLSWYAFRWFQGSPVKLVLLHGCTWLLVALLGAVVWPREKVKAEEGFNVLFRTVLINMSKSTDARGFWLYYPSAYGDTLSPVAVLLYVEIDSKYSRAISISDYTLAINAEPCGWTYLSPIKGFLMFIVDNNVTSVPTIDIHGQTLDELLQAQFPEFGTRRGMLLADTKTPCQIQAGSVIKLRLDITDSTGKQLSYTSDPMTVLQRSEIGTTKGSVNPLVIPMGGRSADLSNAYRKIYSDPIPVEEPKIKGHIALSYNPKLVSIAIDDGAYVLNPSTTQAWK